MATDHRGRGIHAGKRTAQEQGWEEPFTLDHNGRFQTYKATDPTGPAGFPIGTTAVWRNFGNERTTWRVEQNEATPSTANIPDPGTDLGRGKTVDQGWGSSGPGGRAVTGTTRTPARAIIAAEGMKKRIDEGRDLKTGRPKR